MRKYLLPHSLKCYKYYSLLHNPTKLIVSNFLSTVVRDAAPYAAQLPIGKFSTNLVFFLNITYLMMTFL